MTLRRKILWKNIVLLVGVLMLGGAALWGLLAIRNTVNIALREVHELQTFDTLRLRVDLARRDVLVGGDKKIADARNQLDASLVDVNLRPFTPEQYRPGVYDYGRWDVAVRTDVAAGLEAVSMSASMLGNGVIQTDAASNGPAVERPAAQVVELDQVLGRLDQAVRECHDFVRIEQETAGRQLLITLIALSALGCLTLAAAGTFSLWEYRAVMGPLARLRSGVMKVARGDFSETIDTSGDREMSELATDFNRMASELRDFYERLEQKVEQKSRELVRSERLASVGYLAAGVAHEINNPLNIMSGYAELTITRLKKGFDAGGAAEAIEAMRIVRDEAFRCKQITTKLLSMSQSKGESRERFSLADVATDVAKMIAGLQQHRGKQLTLDFASHDGLDVFGNVNEIKQVLLNLMVNALEAVSPVVGRVTIAGRRIDGQVELSITDNGRGIAADTIDRVFEPFFTAKRGAGEPGTGLGLSITHAIVESHGGQLRAASDGLGHGSRFAVLLPAIAGEDQ